MQGAVNAMKRCLLPCRQSSSDNAPPQDLKFFPYPSADIRTSIEFSKLQGWTFPKRGLTVIVRYADILKFEIDNLAKGCLGALFRIPPRVRVKAILTVGKHGETPVEREGYTTWNQLKKGMSKSEGSTKACICNLLMRMCCVGCSQEWDEYFHVEFDENMPYNSWLSSLELRLIVQVENCAKKTVNALEVTHESIEDFNSWRHHCLCLGKASEFHNPETLESETHNPQSTVLRPSPMLSFDTIVTLAGEFEAPSENTTDKRIIMENGTLQDHPYSETLNDFITCSFYLEDVSVKPEGEIVLDVAGRLQLKASIEFDTNESTWKCTVERVDQNLQAAPSEDTHTTLKSTKLRLQRSRTCTNELERLKQIQAVVESNSKLKGHGLIEAVRSELQSNVTDNMVKRILDNSNNLGDNVLTVAHLGGSLRRIGEIIEAFTQFDANEDGQLSATEFEKLLEERGNDVTSTLVGEMMLNADMDHDGNLDLQVT